LRRTSASTWSHCCRAAANWQASHQYIPNGGGAVPENFDLFAFDYITDHADTTNWDIGIRLPEGDPVGYAHEGTPDRHRYYEGHFSDRDFADPTQIIWNIADISNLVRLRPVAASNVHQTAVAPGDAQESLALQFYGNYAHDFSENNTYDETVYVGEPIRTIMWDAAMKELYAVA
jgi:hypothetical protein